MDVGQREVPEREPHAVAELGLDTLDRAERLPRVRALAVAVLDDEPPLPDAADVIHRLVEPIHHSRFTLLLARSRYACVPVPRPMLRASHVVESGEVVVVERDAGGVHVRTELLSQRDSPTRYALRRRQSAFFSQIEIGFGLLPRGGRGAASRATYGPRPGARTSLGAERYDAQLAERYRLDQSGAARGRAG